jgi:hypothetical protein
LRPARRRPLPPDGDNSFGSRCAGAVVGALFAIPLCLAWWGLLVLQWVPMDVALSLRAVAWVVGGFALLGFVAPRLLDKVYGALWDLFGKAWEGSWWH